jgi:hypothetical protein
MAIHLIHGTVPMWEADSQLHKLYVDERRFARYLRSMQRPYGKWDPYGSDGDTLTVDDGTIAGAEACLAARRAGHHVIFFVNPMQIVGSVPYFFSVLDWCVDVTVRHEVTFANSRFDLTDRDQKRAFRNCARNLMTVQSAQEALAMAYSIGADLGIAQPDLPKSMLPISVADLRNLHRQGVQIENHGWSHIAIEALSVRGFEEEVCGARRWLEAELKKACELFAVPYGKFVPSKAMLDLVGVPSLLADDSMAPSFSCPGIWNRRDMTNFINCIPLV